MKPEEQTWCARQDVCACFGTVAPSTAMRDPQGAPKPRCAHFRPDGGTTKGLRNLR